MPILQREVDIFPENLFDDDLFAEDTDSDRCWWALYTLSRREKDLMRRLLAKEIPFYGPMVTKTSKSPSGRLQRSHLPLFPGYVFIRGDESQRHEALTTNCISRCLKVVDEVRLTADLKQFHHLIQLNAALTPEDRMQPGLRVRVKRGILEGVEGTILRREGQLRLLVAVDFLQRGASLLIDDMDVETI